MNSLRSVRIVHLNIPHLIKKLKKKVRKMGRVSSVLQNTATCFAVYCMWRTAERGKEEEKGKEEEEKRRRRWDLATIFAPFLLKFWRFALDIVGKTSTGSDRGFSISTGYLSYLYFVRSLHILFSFVVGIHLWVKKYCYLWASNLIREKPL